MLKQKTKSKFIGNLENNKYRLHAALLNFIEWLTHKPTGSNNF